MLLTVSQYYSVSLQPEESSENIHTIKEDDVQMEDQDKRAILTYENEDKNKDSWSKYENETKDSWEKDEDQIKDIREKNKSFAILIYENEVV